MEATIEVCSILFCSMKHRVYYPNVKMWHSKRVWGISASLMIEDESLNLGLNKLHNSYVLKTEADHESK